MKKALHQPTLFEMGSLTAKPAAYAVPRADNPYALDTAAIPALSLWPLWAAAIAKGDKKIETRQWPTAYRGWLAIASTRMKKVELMAEMSHESPFKEFLAQHYDSLMALPVGKVLALARVTQCLRIVDPNAKVANGGAGTMVPPEYPEAAWGHYAPGRYGWIIDRVIELPVPIPCKGGQRIWKWTPSEDVQNWIRERL